MKFLCMECDEPMRLHRADPDPRGSISAVFACPSCDRAIAMLTNPWETEVVTSLGVAIGGEKSACPFAAAIQGGDTATTTDDGIRWTESALERLEKIPSFVRPMARQGIEQWARSEGRAVVTDEVLEEARGRFGM